MLKSLAIIFFLVSLNTFAKNEVAQNEDFRIHAVPQVIDINLEILRQNIIFENAAEKLFANINSGQKRRTLSQKASLNLRALYQIE